MPQYAAYRIKKYFLHGIVYCVLMCFAFLFTTLNDSIIPRLLVLIFLFFDMVTILKIVYGFFFVIISCLTGIGWKHGKLSAKRLIKCGFSDEITPEQAKGNEVVYWKCPLLWTYVLEVKND